MPDTDHNSQAAAGAPDGYADKMAHPLFFFASMRVLTPTGVDNSKFFLGDMPQIGDAVEMVLVDVLDDGEMRFQLRIKR